MLRGLLPPPCACSRTASCAQGFPRWLATLPASGPPDYYATLGIRPSASLDDVKRAFRAQAKLYHPDVARAASGAEDALAKFKLVNEAYSVLGDVGAWQ